MPANLTDADTFETTVQAPADGDTANAATFQLAPQDLANRTKWLYNRRSPTAYDTWGDEAKTLTWGTVWVETTSATANRLVTLDNTTSPAPQAGTLLYAVPEADIGITVTFQREDATAIAVLTGAAQAGITFVYTGSAWIVLTVEVPGGSTATPWSGLVRG